MHHIIYVRTLYHQYFCIFPRERPFFLVWIRIICTFVHFQIKWSTCDKFTVTEMKSPWSMQEVQGNFKTPLAPKKSETDLDYFYGLVKRQILRWGTFSRHVDIFDEQYLGFRARPRTSSLTNLVTPHRPISGTVSTATPQSGHSTRWVDITLLLLQ